jgi:EAL domain-containing protein (putative c-di-GMP-specific phosphodiesterase class I)
MQEDHWDHWKIAGSLCPLKEDRWNTFAAPLSKGAKLAYHAALSMAVQEDLESSAERARIVDAQFDIRDVLQAHSMASHFQPIISIREKRVIGLEALIRATDPKTGHAISPTYLFDAASRHSQSLALDRFCRESAVEGFAALARLDPELILFVNLDVASLNKSAVESDGLIRLAEEFGISAERVVIEIIESKIRDAAALEQFIANHRKRGFLIALDDMGAGHSNLERIPTIKPDIIKLDRSLIKNIDREYHKQELFDFFIKLAHRIGVIVVVEGIETEGEALSCLEHGADLVQGFYFAHPQPPDRSCLMKGLEYATRLRSVLTEHMVRKFNEKKLKYQHYSEIANRITAVIQMNDPKNYEEVLESALARFPAAECAYVIHESGRQITRTVLNPIHPQRKRTPLFGPAPAGGNQSAKDYFMYLGKNQRRYVTSPYVSVASGNVCITISNRVTQPSGNSYVVCVDINLSADDIWPA